MGPIGPMILLSRVTNTAWLSQILSVKRYRSKLVYSTKSRYTIFLPVRNQLKMSDYTLYVISVISNPIAYESRYRLFEEFQQRLEGTGVVLITVELALGAQPLVVTTANDKNHVQLRAGMESVLWVKESLINIGLEHLTHVYPRWRYVAWIDGDIEFLNGDWVEQTIAALQHHRIVQPWSQCMGLGPRGEAIELSTSHGYCYQNYPITYGPRGKYGTPFWHPGYAWAARRETIEGIGGMIDWTILGSGDNHMAWAFIGNIKAAITKDIKNDRYLQLAMEYQQRCDEHVNGDVGYIPGTLIHHWHGRKKKRFYQERTTVLVKHDYDPTKDVEKNRDGLVVFTGTKDRLRQDVLRYFRSREEDANTLE